MSLSVSTTISEKNLLPERKQIFFFNEFIINEINK